MSSDKVVGLDGKAVEPISETPEKIWSVMEKASAMMRGETHMGIGMVVVDHMGRVATLHFYKAGFCHQTIAGVAILQKRLIEDYEKSLG
jgi:hypothetical protein